MKSLLNIVPVGLLIFYSGFGTQASAEAEISGSIDVVSQYISRGLTNAPENDRVTLQATLSANFDQFYMFYWGSNLNYSFKEIQTGKHDSAGKFEHDLGFGYSFDIGKLNINIWDAFYYYQGGKNTTSNELGVMFTQPVGPTGELSLGVTTFLYDVVYMNQWDSYLQIDYTHFINEKLSASINTGFSYFQDDGKYEGGDFLDTQTDFTFRFASTQLNYIINPHVTGYGKFIWGGYDRADIKQKNMLVLGLNHAF